MAADALGAHTVVAMRNRMADEYVRMETPFAEYNATSELLEGSTMCLDLPFVNAGVGRAVHVRPLVSDAADDFLRVGGVF